ncbi:cell wall-binding repeat-containing protein [Egibacter rhizosphaerae]|nr:cell wall-binding repeat-containing protein [Egibacter rhizosphaerae]
MESTAPTDEPTPETEPDSGLGDHLRIPLGIIAVGAVLLGVALFAQTPEAEVEITRVAGQDRFDTAARLALAAYPDGSDEVVVAAGHGFADALPASGLAGRQNAPVLLVDDEADEVPDVVADAIEELAPTRIHLIGGQGVISAEAAEDLTGPTDADLERYAGDDRFETAALVAEGFAAEEVGSFGGATTVLLVSGRDFADALAAGPLASAGPHPVLLTEPDSLPTAAAEAIDELRAERVVLIGGQAAIDNPVSGALAGLDGVEHLERISGDDRFETAASVARVLDGVPPYRDAERLILTSGTDFADALATGPFAADAGAPLVTVPGELGNAARDVLVARADRLEEVVLVGGTASVPHELEDEIEALILGARE